MVEFENMASISQVISSACFINTEIIPVKSSVLWFRNGKITASQRNNQKKVPLSVENGCTLPTDQEIMKLLRNAKSVSFFNIIFML